jgi:hypothetical protein
MCRGPTVAFWVLIKSITTFLASMNEDPMDGARILKAWNIKLSIADVPVRIRIGINFHWTKRTFLCLLIYRFSRGFQPLIPPYCGVSRIDLSGHSSNIVPHSSTASVTHINYSLTLQAIIMEKCGFLFGCVFDRLTFGVIPCRSYLWGACVYRFKSSWSLHRPANWNG